MTKSPSIERDSMPPRSKAADVIFSSRDQIVCDSGHIRVGPMFKGDTVDKDSTLPKVYWCDFATCCHKSKSSNNMRSHRRMHQRDNPHVCMEINCEARFNSEKLLQKHRKESGHEPASEAIMTAKSKVLSKVNIVNGGFFRSKSAAYKKKIGAKRSNKFESLSSQEGAQGWMKASSNLQHKGAESSGSVPLLSEPIRPVTSGSTAVAFVLCLALFSTVSDDWILGYFSACPIPDTMFYQISPFPRALFHCNNENEETSMPILQSNVTLFPAFTIAHNQQATRPATNKRFMSFIAHRSKVPNVFTFHDHNPLLIDFDFKNVSGLLDAQVTIKQEAEEVSVGPSSSATNLSSSRDDSMTNLKSECTICPIPQAPLAKEGSRSYTTARKQSSAIKQDGGTMIEDRNSAMRSRVDGIPPNIANNHRVDENFKSLLPVCSGKNKNFRSPSNSTSGNAATYSTPKPESPGIPLRQLVQSAILQAPQQVRNTNSNHDPHLLWKLKDFFQGLVLPPLDPSAESQSNEYAPLPNTGSFDATLPCSSTGKSAFTVTISGGRAGDQFRMLTLPGSVLDLLGVLATSLRL